jgi:RNA polymerase sigma-70 factor (sigma-E family)
MDADEDFVDLVSARWTRLYRTAYLLTGNAVAAERLLQDALERTCARWPRVRRTDAPEAYVRKLMVNAVTTSRRRPERRRARLLGVLPDRPVPRADGGAPVHALLWPLVCALPDLQRAVVVLRYYEDLTDGETAVVLGCGVGPARSQAHAATRALRRGLGAAQPAEGARAMNLERELRAMLAQEAERHDAPPPDLDALATGAGSHRRRRRQAVGAWAATLAVLVTVAAGLVLGPRLGETRGAGNPPARPPTPVSSTGVAWCFPDPSDPAAQLVVGVGPAVKTVCSYTPREGDPAGPWDVHRVRYLWHQGGATILTTAVDGVWRVADGRLSRLGWASSSSLVVKLSHDGRFVAWLNDCLLYVYEVPTAVEVTRAALPAPLGADCSGLGGIDDLGRVYVTVWSPGSKDPEVLMYDTRTGESTQVVGIPAGTGDVPSDSDIGLVRYVTADGFAAFRDDYVSVEGTVDATGHFVRRREVPVGRGLWSPDRSLFVEQRPEGVVVHPATDLDAGVVLDVPSERLGPAGLTIVQWVSPGSVLLSRLPSAPPAYRCDARSGACEPLHHAGVLALGNLWGDAVPG